MTHCRIRYEERAGDLRGRQPAHRTQRERHLRWRSKCRVTAQEEQCQRVVPQRLSVSRRRDEGVARGRIQHRLLSALAGAVGSHLVDEAPRGDRDQPAEWLFWDPVPGPRGGSLDQRFLNSILTSPVVAIAPNHGR